MKLSQGTAHKLPVDLIKAISSDKKALEKWESLTPLARNEFICWIEDAKKQETRLERIRRTCEDLMNGKRRPCCWMGCTHRKDKPINPSQKFILSKKSKKN